MVDYFSKIEIINGKAATTTLELEELNYNLDTIIKDDYGIRKLTPKECFNLQGFPKKFKFPEGVPNSQLYKQAGNSVTVEIVKKQAEIIYKALVN